MAEERLQCSWCNAQNTTAATSCGTCGAPLDVADVVTQSGWRSAPRVRDATSFGFSQSTCELEGEIVPVITVNLAAGDSLFFEHHALLWKEESIHLGMLSTGGGIKRMFGGMPFTITTATGPGHIAFSRDSAGELVVLPIGPEHEIDVREHAFLVGSHSLNYSFERIKGLANALHGGSGMYLERFRSANESGLLMLHGSGNVFQRTLGAGESIYVEPGAFLYKDSSVKLETHKEDGVKTSGFGGYMYLGQLTGSGRVGIQSMYHPHGGEHGKEAE
jgi:uncharacterized protein (AIM24 family)